MANDNHVTVAASAAVGVAAALGILAATWRRITSALRAFGTLFGLARAIQGLDGRVGAVEKNHVTREELMALRIDMDKRIARHERTATKAIEGVRHELSEIRTFTATREDTRRIESKLDELLVKNFGRA